MNLRLYKLIYERQGDDGPDYRLLRHNNCYFSGYCGELIMVTNDSYHLLYKHRKPKRMRRAK